MWMCIVTYGGAGVIAARKATATIPIVMAVGPDLVGMGFAASLARPGGNITGLRYLAGDAFAKRQELLKEVDPSITQLGVLLLRGNSFNAPTLKSMRAIAAALKLELRAVEASGPAEYSAAFAALADAKVTGLVIHDNAQFYGDAQGDCGPCHAAPIAFHRDIGACRKWRLDGLQRRFP